MSGLINPHAAPEEAAYALLIELVRAQRVPQYEGDISGLLAIYDEAVKHFKEKEPERYAWRSLCGERVTPAGDAQALAG